MNDYNPCLSCGACCAYARASFYWAEGDDVTEGGVPTNMTGKLNDFRLYMLGTSGINPRCIALQGVIGINVYCSIYARRSSVCRALVPSWASDEPNSLCDKARIAHGLAPIRPKDLILQKTFK